LYLAVADSETLRLGWARHVHDFTLTIHNQRYPSRNVVKQGSFEFKQGASDWGWWSMLTLPILQIPNAGFLVNDKLTVSVRVSIDVCRQLEEAEARVGALELEARARDAAVAELRRRQGDAAALEPLSMEQLELLQSETKDVLSRIEARLRGLNREAPNCHICLEKPKDTIFNCGHTTCATCAEQVTICPDCRTPITTKARFYL